ncbi:hypothetical protein L2E82_48301 [Cichorium intybus]|uniref:Uncharacterized protein n=1 Tax=Cichorium intybus TaxID=13427 RepID=A0ACB8YY05_CICIN|nr:hypothetical protein L2E82_48301 [Cichorium intybus]
MLSLTRSIEGFHRSLCFWHDCDERYLHMDRVPSFNRDTSAFGNKSGDTDASFDESDASFDELDESDASFTNQSRYWRWQWVAGGWMTGFSSPPLRSTGTPRRRGSRIVSATPDGTVNPPANLCPSRLLPIGFLKFTGKLHHQPPSCRCRYFEVSWITKDCRPILTSIKVK